MYKVLDLHVLVLKIRYKALTVFLFIHKCSEQIHILSTLKPLFEIIDIWCHCQNLVKVLVWLYLLNELETQWARSEVCDQSYLL